MRYALALVTLGLVLTLAPSTTFAEGGAGYGPVLEIHRDDGKPQDSAPGPGSTTSPQGRPAGYDAGDTAVPVSPVWIVQFRF